MRKDKVMQGVKGSRMSDDERRRRCRERYWTRYRKAPDTTPIARTGNEEFTNWHKRQKGGNSIAVTVKDRYYAPPQNQTHFIYYPPEGENKGVLNFQIALQNFDDEKFVALIKTHLEFKHYILVSRVIGGKDAKLYDFHCRQKECPSMEKVREIYRAFCC